MLSITLINHLLQQNPHVCHELSQFNGMVVGLCSGSMRIIGQINAQGLLQTAPRDPDVTLTLHPNGWTTILGGQWPNWQDFGLEGDMELGMHLLQRFAQLRYSPHQDLRHLLGADTAEMWAQKAAYWGEQLQKWGQILTLHTAALRQPQPNHTINELQQQLHDTQQRLAYLEARLGQPQQPQPSPVEHN